jgi:hypothetical protein
MTRFVCLVLLGLSLSVSPALAGTFYVGPCHTGSFATITDAINSSKVAPGSIIKVCPADYSEQLIISKSLTIEGLPDTTAGEELPTVFLPSTYTSTSSAFTNTTLIPQAWVTAGTVNFSNIFFRSNLTVADPSSCAAQSGGIFYASGSSGTVNHVEDWSSGGCSFGIRSENTTHNSESVKIENSLIRADNYGIVAIDSIEQGRAPDLSVTITGNQILDCLTGIYLFGVQDNVSGNTISFINTAASGITGILDDGLSSTIRGNTITLESGTAITIDQPGSVVTGNKIYNESSAISIIAIDMQCNAATVSSNTISAWFGIVNAPPGFNQKNTFWLTSVAQSANCK